MIMNTKRKFRYRPGPDGLHLYERETGTNILIDEIDIPKEEWAKAPRQVSIALTNACNMNCPFCYAPKRVAELDLKRLLGWLEELDTNGCLGVGLGGGEPTLYEGLPLICDYIKDRSQLAVTFTTNGHCLTENLVDQLKGRVNFVRVSMDGVGDTYKTLRGKSFSSFCRRLELVKSVSGFGINYVVNAQTLPDLEDAIAIAITTGATEFLLLPEQPVQGRRGIDEHTLLKLRNWVRSYSGPMKLSVSEAGADILPTCDPLSKEKELQSYAHIDASGVIKRSSFDLSGVTIENDGLMNALLKLQGQRLEVVDEDLE